MGTHLLSIDLEDWHTSGYLRNYVDENNFVEQIEESTLPILELLERKNVKATFFVLGSVARSKPLLIRKIASCGHEIASHGYSHTPLWDLTPEKLREEIRKTNNILQDITGKKVLGFRAPYCSLQLSTSWAIDILESEGFLYDSSIFPMKTILYGESKAPFHIYKISSKNILMHSPQALITEVPFSVFRLKFLRIPVTGGIYGRFLPMSLLKYLLKEVAKKYTINFYFHPWETYACTPRIKAPTINEVISYYNTKSYLQKIEEVIDLFDFTTFDNFLNYSPRV